MAQFLVSLTLLSSHLISLSRPPTYSNTMSCAFHHFHSWHVLLLLLLFACMCSVLAVSRPRPSPSLDPTVLASHKLKHPFPHLFHIPSTLPSNDFYPRPLASTMCSLLVSLGKCPTSTHYLQPWPPTLFLLHLPCPKHASCL